METRCAAAVSSCKKAGILFDVSMKVSFHSLGKFRTTNAFLFRIAAVAHIVVVVYNAVVIVIDDTLTADAKKTKIEGTCRPVRKFKEKLLAKIKLQNHSSRRVDRCARRARIIAAIILDESDDQTGCGRSRDDNHYINLVTVHIEVIRLCNIFINHPSLKKLLVIACRK